MERDVSKYAENAYFEVFNKQKHICKNTSINKPSGNLPQGNTNTNRPFYSKKPLPQKPKASNSIELCLVQSKP